jgi:hypothetical protein
MRFWLAQLVLLPLCAWALVELFSVSSAKASVGVATWLVAAVLVHDFVIWPLYTGADRVIGGNNYIRIPGAISLLLLVVFWGTIAGRGERAYSAVSGRTYDGYATRWLLVTAALFAGSALLYRLRRRSGGPRRHGP